MHHTVEQVLRCYVTAHQTVWDLLLPLLYGREPVLPVEHAVRDVTDALL